MYAVNGFQLFPVQNAIPVQVMQIEEGQWIKAVNVMFTVLLSVLDTRPLMPDSTYFAICLSILRQKVSAYFANEAEGRSYYDAPGAA